MKSHQVSRELQITEAVLAPAFVGAIYSTVLRRHRSVPRGSRDTGARWKPTAQNCRKRSLVVSANHCEAGWGPGVFAR